MVYRIKKEIIIIKDKVKFSDCTFLSIINYLHPWYKLGGGVDGGPDEGKVDCIVGHSWMGQILSSPTV